MSPEAYVANEEDGTRELPEDWTEDEETVNAAIEALRGGFRVDLLAFADLLERAAPQFIDACRRAPAAYEAEARRDAQIRADERKAVRAAKRKARSDMTQRN